MSKNIANLCPKCFKMIPNIFNGIPFPCPVLRGYSPCEYGLKWIKKREKEMMATPASNNYNLDKFKDDTQ